MSILADSNLGPVVGGGIKKGRWEEVAASTTSMHVHIHSEDNSLLIIKAE